MNVLGIIPARGGSKGLPHKNLISLGGKPLIAYTFEAARESKRLTSWLVSTDDDEIASFAKRWGAPVPWKRPADLARDETPMLPVLQHAVQQYEAAEKSRPDIIVLLQPIAPFRKGSRIDEAVDLLVQTKADSVIALRETDYSPYWMKTVDKEGRVISLFPKEAKQYTRRQDIPATYRPSGAIYATRYQTLMQDNRILGEDTRALITPFEESINIDSSWDFKMAEILLSHSKEKTGVQG